MVKKNKYILTISLDMCIFLLKIAILNHFQHIHQICYLPSQLCFISEWNPYAIYNHTESHYLIPKHHAVSEYAFLPWTGEQ